MKKDNGQLTVLRLSPCFLFFVHLSYISPRGGTNLFHPGVPHVINSINTLQGRLQKAQQGGIRVPDQALHT